MLHKDHFNYINTSCIFLLLLWSFHRQIVHVHLILSEKESTILFLLLWDRDNYNMITHYLGKRLKPIGLITQLK